MGSVLTVLQQLINRHLAFHFINDQNPSWFSLLTWLEWNACLFYAQKPEKLSHDQRTPLSQEVWPQNTAESAVLTEGRAPQPVNCMCPGDGILLIVMNGVSHDSLFNASWLPGESEPRERSPWLLNCFHTVTKTEEKQMGLTARAFLRGVRARGATKERKPQKCFAFSLEEQQDSKYNW